MEPARPSTPADAALARAAELARDCVASLPDRPVHATVPLAALRARFGGPLPERGEDPVTTVEALAANARDALIGSAGPRSFGFVTTTDDVDLCVSVIRRIAGEIPSGG